MADISDTYCGKCHEFAMNKADDGHIYCAWCDADQCVRAGILHPSMVVHKHEIPRRTIK
jgi:hypothetical protein